MCEKIKNTPAFSVVVPVYGVEKYIDQCVRSILGQSYTDLEVILVDDGSKDGCPAMCDEYARLDSRVRVIHKQNSGVVETRRVGVDASCGEYLVFVDGDDWMEPNYLSEFAAVIAECKPDVICCGYSFAYDDGKRVPQPLAMEVGSYGRERLRESVFPWLIEDKNCRYFPAMLWSKAYKRELYAEHQVPCGVISVGEDHACTKPCIYHAETMYVIDKCLYNYRQNPASVTKAGKAFAWDGPRLIGMHFEAHMDMSDGDLQEQVYRSITHNLFNAAVSQFNRAESYKVIKAEILQKISEPYYQNAINKCSYDGFKGKLAKTCLKHRLIFLMRIYNKTVHS